MPYSIRFGKDKKGNYAISTEKLHSKKYYYTTDIGKTIAINKVLRYNKAIFLSELRYKHKTI